MKNQKGFISISILVIIVASVFIASVGTGVVLYRKEKLNLDANISEPIKENIELVQQKEPEIEFQTEEITQEENSQTAQKLEQAKLEAEEVEQEAERAKAEAERLRAEQEAEKVRLETERLKAEQEAERVRKEIEETKNKAEAERLRAEQEAQKIAEQQRQKELERQKEIQRIAEKKQKQEELKIFQKIESDVNYYSRQINSIETDINQITNSYRVALDANKTQYLNQADWAESIYKPEMERLHEEILNEATKGLWTNCMTLASFWGYQNSYYGQYSTTLISAERTLKDDINRTGNEYYSLYINRYENIVNEHKDWLNELLKELNLLSISDKESFQREINNLITKLNSLSSKINETKNFRVSYSTPASILSSVEKLMQEEKKYFAETSCGNLPRH